MTGLIIHPGGKQISSALALATRTNKHIPNERCPRRPPPSMNAAYEIWRRQFPDRQRVELRALDSTYNCVGLVFANRRAAIDAAEVEMILREDEYTRRASVDHGREGDVAVYRSVDTGAVTHVGFVARAEVSLMGEPTRLRILSQWGFDGEYLHDADAVPSVYGRLAEIWTYRYGAP